MKVARSLVVMAFLAGITGAALAGPIDGTGIQGPRDDTDHWRGRLSLTSQAGRPWPSSPALGGPQRSQVNSTTIVADYFFAAPATVGPASGFRASGGIGFARQGGSWLGRIPLGASTTSTTSQSADGDNAASTYSYLGVGYSGIYPRSGWGFTADVGLMGGTTPRIDGASTVALDGYGMRAGADSPIAQMRLRPVFQVGVSYSF